MTETVRKNIYKTVMVEPDAVLDSIERRYGFVVDKIVRLHGFCDLTFHVVQARKRDNEPRKEYIFKLFADPYTSNAEQIKAEIGLMQFLARNGIPVPSVIAAKDQRVYCKIDLLCGQPYFTRMQTYLKGNLLRDAPLTADLCKKLGLLVGRIDSALEKFTSPFYEKKMELDFLVNYNENERLAELLPYLKNERAIRLASAGFELFEQKIRPNFTSLPIQQIHGDLDCVNIIVNTSQPEKDGLPSLSVIDFADSRKTCRIYEPACSIAGILAFGKPDPFVCAKSFLNSYRSVVQMTELELSLLRACVIARFAFNITFHEFNATTDAKYDGYMLKACGQNSYELLERLLAEEQSDSLAFLQ